MSLHFGPRPHRRRCCGTGADADTSNTSSTTIVLLLLLVQLLLAVAAPNTGDGDTILFSSSTTTTAATVSSTSSSFSSTITAAVAGPADDDEKDDGEDVFMAASSASGSLSSSSLSSSTYFADKFPSLRDTTEMARLSHLVYQFSHEADDYCDAYSHNSTQSYNCEWYHHYDKVGTKVLIMTDHQSLKIIVIFAGTDDIRTSLEDGNIATKLFGNANISFPPDPHGDVAIKVHAGFNNAVFSHGIWEDIYGKIRSIKHHHPLYSLWTTGHSLGGANAILTATAFAIKGYKTTSITFGCPRIGNWNWKYYFDDLQQQQQKQQHKKNKQYKFLHTKLSIWRVVLGWDLVPRLPDFYFYHTGHTIQLWCLSSSCSITTKQEQNSYLPDTVETYYEHYGDDRKGYAGVNQTWTLYPNTFPPWSMQFHYVMKYVNALEILLQKDNDNKHKSHHKLWNHQFVPLKINNGDESKENKGRKSTIRMETANTKLIRPKYTTSNTENGEEDVNVVIDGDDAIISIIPQLQHTSYQLRH